MKNIQTIGDKTAISLSLICTAHCLVLPLLTVLLPAVAALNLGDEAFHLWLLVAVIPTSLFATTMGCRKHRNFRVALLGGAGLIVLIGSALTGHDILGETGEKMATVFGACLIAAGHLLNHRLCQHANSQCH